MMKLRAGRLPDLCLLFPATVCWLTPRGGMPQTKKKTFLSGSRAIYFCITQFIFVLFVRVTYISVRSRPILRRLTQNESSLLVKSVVFSCVCVRACVRVSVDASQ